ncbi:MAG: hypothetical protein HYT21_01810 [Candidatus Nealsonbacteria bacterium]|nr:hypothetical protein [Candidatus Nealsonbacteria bacterium]
MINLLPPAEKRILEAENGLRLVVIWGVIALFAFVALFLILLSIKFYVSGMVDAREILVRLEEERFAGSQAQDLTDEIGAINAEINRLEFFYQNQISFSGALSLVAAAMPNQARLNTLYFNIQNEDGEQTLKSSLTGYAPVREALFVLKKNLGDESGFRDIDFPPSNWVKPADINFSVTFNINEH